MEEQELIAMGYPISEVLGMCDAMRRDGTLGAFISEQREAARPPECPLCPAFASER